MHTQDKAEIRRWVRSMESHSAAVYAVLRAAKEALTGEQIGG